MRSFAASLMAHLCLSSAAVRDSWSEPSCASDAAFICRSTISPPSLVFVSITCRRSAMSRKDCSCIVANWLVIVCDISLRSSSIFFLCSSCSLASVSVTLLLVSSREFSSLTSLWIFCSSSLFLLSPSAAAPSFRRCMQSWCRCLIWSRVLWLLSSTIVCLSVFRTCIIFCAKVSVMYVSLHHSSSGPMFATNNARAAPPRQSRSIMVRAEFR
mmetsp:Transcript_62283/g.193036  ORF Transcript_62283/g.193036 Transcript_62283/m.193036 type:complete len:213 (-) Transcript_62283:515-1153(-)